MSTPFQPIKMADLIWRDGLPFASAFDDIYFSKDNALAESLHVFIEGNQLIARWEALADVPFSSFVIAETGFGSGLNFLLTWSLWKKYAPPSATLHYISCEQYPLSHDDLSQCLALWPSLQEQADLLLEHYPILTPGFHCLQFADARVNLTLMLGDALDCYRELLICGDANVERQLREYYVDAWFLDGFSPAKNPLMWSEKLFTTLGFLSKKGTTVATYSAAGVVKQGLKAAGFSVHKKPGHGLKHDMVVAEFEQLPELLTKAYGRFSDNPDHVLRKTENQAAAHVRVALSIGSTRHTPWHVSAPYPVKMKKAIVLGAGLAGCYTAHALARRGWEVTLLDEQTRVGCGASGISQAILFPQLTSFCSPLTAFMLTSYLFAIRSYQALSKKGPVGDLSGLLQLAYNPQESDMQANLQSWLAHYPQLAVCVDAKQASALAGVALHSGGLFIPHSGWLDSPKIGEYLLQTPGIHWVGNTRIDSIDYDGREWYANEHHADVLVIANGDRASQFVQTAHLPLKAIRGQMTSVRSNEQSDCLRIPLCADGHVLPARAGTHALGATYHIDPTANRCFMADDALNIAKLQSFSTEFTWSHEVGTSWSGIRAATPDYLPLVGPVAPAALFKQQYKGLASNANRWIPFTGDYYEKLYVCAGFGSRGLTTIPLSAESLAAMIDKGPVSLTRSMLQSLSPSRFLYREISRNAHN